MSAHPSTWLSSSDWGEYYQAVLDKPLHPLFGELEKYLPEGRDAVDIGCGVGHGTLFLLECGFKVLAVDAEAEAVEIVRSRASHGTHLKIVQSRFEDFSIPEADLIIAFFSLFFLPQSEFRSFWTQVRDALRPGGVFAGQFLGVHDDWVARNYAVVDAATTRQMLEGLEVLHFEEVEQDGATAQGTPKHWHIFHLIARKPTA